MFVCDLFVFKQKTAYELLISDWSSDVCSSDLIVWGARTLAGNDNEWRYVNVRRLFITVEESAKKATMQFVFEPNDANTWVKLRAMLENYLTLLWRQGALAGSKPAHAFYVRCGLNQTMTAQDILEGKLIVEIGMAAVCPAEFRSEEHTSELQSLMRNSY